MKLVDMGKAEALMVASMLVTGKTYRVVYVDEGSTGTLRVQQDFYWDGIGYMSKTTLDETDIKPERNSHSEKLHAITGLDNLVHELMFHSTEDEWNDGESFKAEIIGGE